jgi:hypothetical protein
MKKRSEKRRKKSEQIIRYRWRNEKEREETDY